MIDAAAVHAALPYAALADAVDEAFRGDVVSPLRHVHEIAVPGGTDGAMLLMPAWQAGGYGAVKIVSLFPGNAQRGLASVLGTVILFDATSGQPLAAIDGQALTLRRTAAVSALAARYLARADAGRLLVVGAGALGCHLARAHAAVRPITHTAVWNRSPAGAERLVKELRAEGMAAERVTALDDAVAAADVVTCATMTPTPLVRGAFLRPGSHLDLVGAYRPDVRESDDEAIRRASLFADTREGALAEAGDILIPLRAGLIGESHIQGDLTGLARGAVAGRTAADEVTAFKSVGSAVADLTAARMVYEAAARTPS